MTLIRMVWYWQKNRQIHGAEWRAQKLTYTNRIYQTLKKEQRKFNREKIVFSTNVDGTTGHPHTKILI